MFRGSWNIVVTLLSRQCHTFLWQISGNLTTSSFHVKMWWIKDGQFLHTAATTTVPRSLRFKDLIVVLTLSHYITHLISAPSRTMITMVSVHKSVSWRGSMNRRKCCPLEMLIILLGFITNTALAKVVVIKRPHLPPGWTKHFRFPIGKYLPQWNIAQVFYQ